MRRPGKPDSQLKRSPGHSQVSVLLSLLGLVTLAILVVPWRRLTPASSLAFVLILTFPLLAILLLTMLSRWATKPDRGLREAHESNSGGKPPPTSAKQVPSARDRKKVKPTDHHPKGTGDPR